MPPLDFAARSRAIDSNGIRMQVYEDGPEDGPPIVFCHGFPQIAFSWRHQLSGLGELGYRTIAPDLRGHGETERSPKVEDYRLGNLREDVLGMLEALGVERKPVFVGHDWGSLLVYSLAVANPDRCRGVVSLNTPYRPRTPIHPIEALCRAKGGEHYMVVFQKAPQSAGDSRAGIAENVLGADVLKTFRSLMLVSQKTYAEHLAARPDVMEIFPIGIFVGDPELGELPLLSSEEQAVYVATYQRTGFTGGLNWYRNLVRNWQDARPGKAGADHPDAVLADGVPPEEGTWRIRVPALVLLATRDPAIDPAKAESNTGKLIQDLVVEKVDCGHWMPEEKPREVNERIHAWIQSHP